MMKIEQLNPTDYSFIPQLLATLIASLSIALFSSNTFAQGLSVNMTDDLVPSVGPISRVITVLDTDFGAYDQRQIEPLQDLGRQSQSAGEYQQALSFFKQALALMAILLVTQFNSYYQALLILSSVLLSTAGVLLGLLITGQTFSIILTGIGIVALAGIIVNNNIVLIDTFNHLREQHKDWSLSDIIVHTGVQRLRPVFLTTFTTGFGLLP
jgi:hypothetical protein